MSNLRLMKGLLISYSGLDGMLFHSKHQVAYIGEYFDCGLGLFQGIESAGVKWLVHRK